MSCIMRYVCHRPPHTYVIARKMRTSQFVSYTSYYQAHKHLFGSLLNAVCPAFPCVFSSFETIQTNKFHYGFRLSGYKTVLHIIQIWLLRSLVSILFLYRSHRETYASFGDIQREHPMWFNEQIISTIRICRGCSPITSEFPYSGRPSGISYPPA